MYRRFLQKKKFIYIIFIKPMKRHFQMFPLSLIRNSHLAEAEYVDSCGKSTCPKTPQEAAKLLRRLRPCPRKAKYSSRSEFKHFIINRTSERIITKYTKL